MAEQPPVNMIINPNEQMLRYMEASNGFMQDFARQLDTNDLVSGIHVFSGNCAKSFRDWMRDLDRIYIDHDGDNYFMRRLVTRTVRDLAADFLADIKRNAAALLTWEEIRAEFYNRFSNYVDAQIAQQKLKKLKQERKQGLHSFAQCIQDTAREAYTAAEINNPLVIRELKNIFIDGLRDHRISQRLIKEDVADIDAALNRAIRDELLSQTFRLRHLTTDDSDHRHITDMDVDAIHVDEQNNSRTVNNRSVSQEQWSEMADSIAAIAAAVRPPNVNTAPRNTHQLRHNAPFHNTRNQFDGRHVRQVNQRQQFIDFSNQGHNNTCNFQNRNNRNDNLRWADNGDPICNHCNKQGHVRRQCWILFPAQRPNNGPRPQAPRMGN